MPASWKSQSNSTPVASSTRLVASASSGPVPSPGMKVTLCVKTVLSVSMHGAAHSSKATAHGAEHALPSAEGAGQCAGNGRMPPSRVVFGGGSIQLARVFGIRIGVDVSWFLVLFLIIYWLTGYYQDVGAGSNAFLLATISALLFFLSILLHE